MTTLAKQLENALAKARDKFGPTWVKTFAEKFGAVGNMFPESKFMDALNELARYDIYADTPDQMARAVIDETAIWDRFNNPPSLANARAEVTAIAKLAKAVGNG